MLVLIGESGCGKTTAEKKLEQLGFIRAISHVSREKRVGETEGVEYFYITLDELLNMEKRDELAEHIEYNGNHYALCREQCQDNRVVSVVPEGLSQLKAKKDLDIFVVYLSAKIETRRQRMQGRGDKAEYIEQRIREDNVVFYGISGEADAVILTDDLTEDEVAKAILELYTNR